MKKKTILAQLFSISILMCLLLSSTAQAGLDVWYEYHYVTADLKFGKKVDTDTYEPYAISVKILDTNVTKDLTVVIIVDGSPEWSGALGEGESSPTITVTYEPTFIRFYNWNQDNIDFLARITLVMN